MKAMLLLFVSMPKMVLFAVLRLLKKQLEIKPTGNDLIMWRKAIKFIESQLPLPESDEEASALLRVMEWFDGELDAIAVLERLNFVVGGTVPVVHNDSVPPERLS